MIMAQMIYGPVMYLNCVFELFLLYNLLEVIYRAYDDRKRIRFMEIIGCSMIIFLINCINVPTINLFCVPLIYLFFVWLMFRIELKYIFFYVLFYYAILAVTEFTFIHIYTLLEIDVSKADFSMILFLFIQKIFEFAVVQMIKKLHQGPYESGSFQYLRCLFMLPIASLVLLNGFLLSEQSSFGYLLICVGGVLLIISIVIGFSTVEKLLKAEGAARDAELLALKTKLERSHYQRIEEINQDYAEYLHEMNRIIRIMEQLACTDDNVVIKGTVEKVSQMGRSTLKQCYINDQITNAIFIEREKNAMDKGLNYQVDIQSGIDVSFIDDLDKISMFGNLLDNALEAAEGCKEGYVFVSLYKGNEALVILRIENNFKIKPHKIGEKYFTTKRKKRKHGFGIKKAEELSEKYGGILKCYEEGDTFLAVLMLSNIPNLNN